MAPMICRVIPIGSHTANHPARATPKTRPMELPLPTLIATASLLTFVSCGCGEEGDCSPSMAVGVSPAISAASIGDASTPDGAMSNAISQLKAGKVSEFLRAVAPAQGLAEMKDGWEDMRKQPIEEADDEEFVQMMGMLTAEGAEDMLFMMVKPQLAEAQQQVQMLAAMAPMMAAGALQEANAPEDAMVALQSFGEKLAKIDIGSEDKAKKAIAIVCSAARTLDVPNGAAMQKLKFEEGLGKIDVVYGALVGVLNVYDLGLDETFDSISIRTVSVEGDAATLEMTIKPFGIEMDPVPFPLERVDGRWQMPYEKEETTTPDDGMAR